MHTREIILSKPSFRKGAGVVISKLTHDMITISVKMWEQSNVYAIIVHQPTADLLSSQIAEGLNANN